MDEPASDRASTWRRFLFLLIPAAAAFGVYANTLTARFVYDDSAQIGHNPWVTELRHFPKAVTRPVWAFRTNIPTNYFRPFQMGAYNLMWAASGGRPLLFHLVNVLFHVAATSALAWFVWRVARDRLIAFGTALLFAVHPLNTEAVAWIACLPELSYATFGLIALILHVEAWKASPGIRNRLRAGELAAFALSLVSKETATTLVVLVFLLELWVRPALARRRGGGDSDGSLRKRLWPSIAACIPYVAVVAFYAVLRFVAVGGVAPLIREGFTTWDAVLNAPWLVLAYVGKMIWPARLVAYHVFDPVVSATEPAFLLGLVGVVIIAGVVLWLSRRHEELAFAGSTALVPLLPVLYIPAVGLNVFAERYTYLPTAGIAWLVVAAVLAASNKLAGARARTATIAVCVLLSLPAAARTVARNRVWHDDLRLASTTVRQSPRSRVMWSLLAGAYRADGQAEKSLETYEKALEYLPNDPLIRADIVGLQIMNSRIPPAEAVRRLGIILNEGQVTYEIYLYLGWAHTLNGDHAGAESAYRTAIELNPSSKPAYDGLALAMIAQGRVDVEQTGLRERSGFTLSGEMDLLIGGAAHLKAGRLDEAERAYNEVLETFPDSAGALFSLAMISAQRSDHASAVEYCRRAIDVQPELVNAYQQLGVSALAIGRIDEAVEALETAVGINPFDKEIYNRLGVAYARTGRLDDARRAWNQALGIDPEFEKARFNLERLESQR